MHAPRRNLLLLAALLGVLVQFAGLPVGGPESRPLVVSIGRADAQSLLWNVRADFRVSPNQANPNPDSFGNLPWYFLQGTPHHPKTYVQLPEFITAAFGVPDLQQWQGSFIASGPNDKLPAAGVNHSKSNRDVGGILWGAWQFRIHPSPDDAVIVGWQSPISGLAKIHVRLTDMDPSTGDGVRLTIDRNATTLITDVLANGGQRSLTLVSMFVPGDFLYIILDAGALADFTGDSTRLQLALTVP